ncbi:UNVERIFIED_CONTAM: hypothetical protein GTU68_046212 [Idotea baltica]|nr:hypothetical protein [Idotea baltica]
MPRYDFARIETSWQQYWEENSTFEAEPATSPKPKMYALDMFPYPSGSGLHVGHPEGYTATDIVCRFERMNGKNVLHPMGWDSFGLPAEEHAVKTGTHPRETTEKNIATFKRQLKMLGFSYDWSREVATTDPEYYRWTQWIFLQLYKYRLAYLNEAPVNWCPALGTVLANEEIIDGKSERGSHPVERVALKQWMLNITAYGDRLGSELDNLDWPDSIKSLQRNWIGRSTGAEVDFFLEAGEDVLRVYTTRPDTLYGATYMVIAPEHPFVDRLTTEDQKTAVADYVKAASLKSDLDRTELAKDKTGVFSGSYAVNPINGEQVPIWVADYVLISYGTGAIMAVPGHDLRDFEFAVKFNIPVTQVKEVDGVKLTPFAGHGTAINSGELNGQETAEAKATIIQNLDDSGIGKSAVNYKLRDWLFSRQRYWGEPFPIWHELGADGKPTGLMRTEPVETLPVPHPHMEDFKPTGSPEPMLAKAGDEWLYKTADDGVKLKRETNSMPQWAGSCWYFLRFCDPKNSEAFIDPEAEKYWLPVDLYIGGAEHAVLHLLYARFWHKVLFDRGHVSTPEPFHKLVNQGMILGDTDYSDKYSPLTDSQVEKKNGQTYLAGTEIELRGRTDKMSKSRHNVINPDDVVNEYGADSLRLYEMFMGPLEQVKPWSMKGVEGVYRFLGRVWRMVIDDRAEEVATEEQLRILHKTIKAVTDDIGKLSFNTAISRMMEFTNFMSHEDSRPKAVLEPFVLLLSPFAPHMAEELWKTLGHTGTLAYQPWPTYDESLLIEDTVEIPVQFKGKLKARIHVPHGLSAEELQAAAEADETVQKHLEGKMIIKVIAIPGRTVNFVVR